MKKTILPIFCLFFILPAFSQYVVRGGKGTPLSAENNTYNRIQVYLLNGLEGAEISFTSTSGTHQWYKYDLRANEAEAIPSRQNGNTSTISDVSDGYGYFVGTTNDPATSYIWIIDYSRYIPVFHSLTVEDGDDKCEFLKLVANITAPALTYHTPAGAPVSLPRTWRLTYSNLKWNEETLSFLPEEENLPQTGNIREIVVDAPLKNTAFTLTGDDYARHFGLEQSVRSAVYEAVALDVHAVATTFKTQGENEQSAGGIELGGSAPVEIRFDAYANEPVAALYIWKIMKINPLTRDSTAIIRYTDRSVTYNFQESGSYVAQMEVSNYQSSCYDNSQSFTIFIGESDLQLPNAFSPGTSPGSNDEYRISYKSLVSFKASIYNRSGNLLYHWEDPSKGWDGRVGGKYVPTGVYYIVVEALGADGKKYTRSSDINILRSKHENSTINR